jgi:hypothetical protein
MAEKTDVTAQEYMDCEEGRSDLNFAFIYRCAMALKVNVTDIIEGYSPKLRSYTVTRNGAGQEIAKAHSVHPAIICLKWALARSVLPIPFSVHNYEANLKAAVTEKLTDEEMAVIAALERGNRLVKGQVFLWEGAKDWHDLWDEDGVIVDCTDC